MTAGIADSYPTAGLDIQPGDRTEFVLDMRRLPDAISAFAGIDTVIDLAATAKANTSWDEVLTNNLPATVNTFEAARRCGVRRVVFASSNHVIGLAERDEPYVSVLAGRYAGLDPTVLRRLTVDDPVRPDGPYAVGKVMGEAIGRNYSEEYGLSVLCLRIGSVIEPDRPTSARHFSTLLTKRDLLRLIRCALEAPDSLRYGVYFGVSDNRWRIWDLENAIRELGYRPADDAERWRSA